MRKKYLLKSILLVAAALFYCAVGKSQDTEPISVGYVTSFANLTGEGAADPVVAMLEADPNIVLTVIEHDADDTGGPLDLSGYDVVVAQEAFSSSSTIYKRGQTLGLGTIPVPFVHNKVYTLRDGRGFQDGAAGSGGEVEGTLHIRVDAANQGNDLFKGFTFDGDSVQVFVTGADDNGGDTRTKGMQFATDVVISEANTLLASGVNDPENATVCINDVPAGATVGSETLQARMIAFGMNYGAMSKPYDMTSEGMTLWRNAIYMLGGLEVPEELVEVEGPPSITFVRTGDNNWDSIVVANIVAKGYDVTEILEPTLTSAQLPDLNAADVVIMGRSMPSSTVQAAMSVWDSITAPVLSMNPWGIRNSRDPWFNTGTAENIVSDIDTVLQANIVEADPVFGDLSGTFDVWTGYFSIMAPVDAGNGYTYAETNDGRPILTRWAKGVPFYEGSTTPLGDRSYIGLGNDNTAVNYWGFTDDGAAVFFNELARLASGEATVIPGQTGPISVGYVTSFANLTGAGAADPVVAMLEADENVVLTVIEHDADDTGGPLDLSGYDVVVAQEAFSSSSTIYKRGQTLGLGTIPVPFVHNKVYTMRDGRGFQDGAAGSGGEVEGTLHIRVDAANQGNDLFKGFTFDGDSVQVFLTGGDDNGGDTRTKGMQYATDVVISEANTLLASGVNDPENATVCINDIPAGATIGSETLQARMITFGMNYGAMSKPYDITSEGLTLWRNAIYMLGGLEVPEELVEVEGPPSITFVRSGENNWDSIVVANIAAKGYIVTEILDPTLTSAQLPELNAADVVIMGRSMPSSTVLAGMSVWDSITAPVLSMNPWGIRNSRDPWFNTGTAENIVTDIDTVLQANILVDDAVFGDLSGSFDVWTGYFSAMAPVDAGNGYTLAETNDGRPILTRWAKGVPFYEGSSTPLGDRSYIGLGNDNTEVNYWGFTDDGAAVFFNELARLASGEITVVPMDDRAQITFIVDDSQGQTYTGFALKGSWNTASGEYDAAWNNGDEHTVFYDDGTNGDVTAGDHIWTVTVALVPDGGANTWEWGFNDDAGNWIPDANQQFTVPDATAQTLPAYVITSVGTDDYILSDVSVYPVPAVDNIIVSNAKNANISIFNISGTLLASMKAKNDQFSINISDLNSGMYILNVQENSAVRNLRFIKE